MSSTDANIRGTHQKGSERCPFDLRFDQWAFNNF